MEAGSTDRDLHSDPQRRAKVHIYRQFPSETHIRRPSPRPFTQEIAGSNPDGGTSLLLLLHFSIARTGRHSAGSRRSGPRQPMMEAPCKRLWAQPSVASRWMSRPLRPSPCPSTDFTTMSWSPETNSARFSYPQITHPRRETASEARILSATLSCGGPPPTARGPRKQTADTRRSRRPVTPGPAARTRPLHTRTSFGRRREHRARRPCTPSHARHRRDEGPGGPRSLVRLPRPPLVSGHRPRTSDRRTRANVSSPIRRPCERPHDARSRYVLARCGSRERRVSDGPAIRSCGVRAGRGGKA